MPEEDKKEMSAYLQGLSTVYVDLITKLNDAIARCGLQNEQWVINYQDALNPQSTRF